jgi:hypothetical protein
LSGGGLAARSDPELDELDAQPPRHSATTTHETTRDLRDGMNLLTPTPQYAAAEGAV